MYDTMPTNVILTIAVDRIGMGLSHIGMGLSCIGMGLRNLQ